VYAAAARTLAESLCRRRIELVLGGALAAPLAAYAAKAIPDQPLMLLVGALIMLLSLRGLVQLLG
jgi:hypothetical protein